MLGQRRQVQPPQEVRYVQRSAVLLKHARAVKSAGLKDRQFKELFKKDAEKDELIGRVREHFPGVANALKIPRVTKKPKTGDDKDEDRKAKEAEWISNIAGSVYGTLHQRGLGVRFERLQCFAHRLAHDLQKGNLIRFLAHCAAFRNLSTISLRNRVVLAYSHQSDSTIQQLAQSGLQRLGRATKARLATEVMHHLGRFRAVFVQIGQDGNILAMAWAKDDWCATAMLSCPKLHRSSQEVLS